MLSFTVHPEDGTAEGRASIRYKKNHFRVSCFQQTSERPAEMCDGGDWVKTLDIHLNDEGIVSIYWQREERSKHHRVNLPYKEFFDKFADFVESLEKEMQADVNRS